MKIRRSVSWFATEPGRKFVFGGVCCLGIGISSAYFLSHTFLLNKYKEIVQMYGLGIGIPIPGKVQKRIEDVMNDMKLSVKERKLIRPFTVFGFDMFHAGCLQTRSGAIVGIPSNFGYSKPEDVDRNHLLVNMDQVSWNSQAGKKLLDAVILSEDAQKFAIAREIAYVRTQYVYYNSIFPVAVITFLYAFTNNCNNRLDLFNKPLSMRVVLYTLVGLFGFGSWAFMKDFTAICLEAQVDKEVCALGENYIKGGIEFYTKLLNRNISLRMLMGEKGEKLYTTTGNEQYMLRQKHMPLTYRMEYFKLQLDELNKQTESGSTKGASDSKSQNIPQGVDPNIQAPA
ncbi:transmembrane protein 177 [Periplaneta americana]|uniref:transmembrane protein 177 n=1 Tax=Periplaneta americana TaxID=6978 RepID=UPI0037E82C37